MQDYKIVIKSTNQIEQTNTFILKEIETIEILLKKLLKINDLASINAYTYKNKYIGIDYSLKSYVKSVFNDDYNPQIQETPFNIPTNPFKRVKWIFILNSKNLFDIVNLYDIDPINKQSIGTWNKWGSKNNISKKKNNHPENLIIIKYNNMKYAYNKYCLLELIRSNKLDTVELPHCKCIINKSYIVDKLHVFKEILPVININ